MYALLIVAALGATDLQAEKDWYLSRKLYESQVRKGMTVHDYYKAQNDLAKLSPQDQRAFIGAERIRSQQMRRNYEIFMEGQRMRIEQTRPKPIQRVIPQYYYPPPSVYRKPYYAYPYPNFSATSAEGWTYWARYHIHIW
jgi:hypothetical protein